MNIYAKEGDKVIYCNPNNGYQSDKNQCDRLLKIGEVYTVNSTDVGSSYTDVYLKEFPMEVFNSVMFDDFNEPVREELSDELNVQLGWFVTLPDGNHTTVLVDSEAADFYKKHSEYKLEALYRIPKIKTLTDVEIRDTVNNADYTKMVTADDVFYIIARAVEKSLEEKNG